MELKCRNISEFNFEPEYSFVNKLANSIPKDKIPLNGFPEVVFCSCVLQMIVDYTSIITENEEDEFLGLFYSNTAGLYSCSNHSIYLMPLAYDEKIDLSYEFMFFHEMGHAYYFSLPKDEIKKNEDGKALEEVRIIRERYADDYSLEQLLNYNIIQKNELRFTDDNSYKFYTNQIKSLGIKIDEKNYKIAAKILSKQFYME